MFMNLPRFFGVNWRLFCGIILTISIPTALLSTAPLVFNWLPWGWEFTALYGPAVTILCSLLWVTALIYAAARIKRDLPVSYRDSLQVAVKKWPRLLIIGILALIFQYALRKIPYLVGFNDRALVGTIICYALAAYPVLRYLMLPVVLTLENDSLWQSLKRSVAVKKSRALQVAGEFILLCIVVMLVEKVLLIAVISLLALFFIPGYGGLPAIPVVQLPISLLLTGIIKPLVDAFIPLGLVLMHEQLLVSPADSVVHASD